MPGAGLAKLLAAVLLLLPGIAGAGADEFVLSGGFARGNVTTSGAAVVTSSGLLQLINDTTNEMFGRGFYPVPLRFTAAGAAPRSFSTTFVCAVVPRYPEAHGHGLVFALAPSPAVPGALAGRNLGLFNRSDDTGQGRSGVVAVELDTAMDEDFRDIDNNHVGVDVNSLVSVKATPAGYYDARNNGRFVGLSIISGERLQVWIEYDGASMRLEVTVAPAGEPRPAAPLVSCTVNLSSATADDTYVGFSAANGAAASSHYVLGWSFRLGGGRAPELDLSKLPKLPAVTRPKRTAPLILVVTLLLLAVVVLLVASAAFAALVINHRRRFAEEEEDWEVEYGTHRIKYKDLHAATTGFRDVIGAGGFGSVYHGVLPRSGEVAVKKVAHDSRQGLREFVAEIASLSRLRHRNLVQLLGYCRRRGELVLVYEYMANGSLDRHLFDPDRTALSWDQRARIVRGVTAGLLYLHEGWELVVVHRDIKSGNVLLDAEMNAKLSDFGLARLYDHGSRPQTTHVVGTIGYLAPEMSKTGKATTSTDVYAFGAFLLEVACGRRPLVFNDSADSQGLVDFVLEQWKAGRIKDARDPRMIGKCDEDDLELVLKLGLLCSHPDPRHRPSMRQAMQILEGTLPVPDTAPEDLDSNGRLFFGYNQSFDEFVNVLRTTSTTITTQPSSSYSSDEQRQLMSG
jgi:hypothetical protein